MKIGDKFLIVRENNPELVGKIATVDNIYEDVFTINIGNVYHSEHYIKDFSYTCEDSYSYITIIPLSNALKVLYAIEGENNNE